MSRVLTYNIHRCVGVDRRLDIDRIASVIAAQRPDIVALQEVDVGRARTGGVDQARAIAERLGMAFHFHAALTVAEERYGDAVLTGLPLRLIKAGPLPGHPSLPRLEPRGALWVAIEIEGAEIAVLNTHLGLIPKEQRLQAAALTGPAWLGGNRRHDPLIVLGDFNTGARGAASRTLRNGLTDAAEAAGAGRSLRTYPSIAPIRRLDHVFVSPGIRVDAAFVVADTVTRRASDHLPLVVDFALNPH